MPSKKRTGRKQNALGGYDLRPQRTICGKVIPAVYNLEQVRVMRVSITSILYMVLIVAYCMLDAGVPRIWHAHYCKYSSPKVLELSVHSSSPRNGCEAARAINELCPGTA